MGEHGHTSTVFKRAIERGNLVAAELALREAGQVDLGDALEFVVLVALRDRTRSRRMCVRWLERYVGETAGRRDRDGRRGRWAARGARRAGPPPPGIGSSGHGRKSE